MISLFPCTPLIRIAQAILVTSVILSAAPINWNIPEPGEVSRLTPYPIIHILSVTLHCVFEGAHSSALPYGLLLFFEIGETIIDAKFLT